MILGRETIVATHKQQPASDRAELLALSQAILITAIGARGAVPTGDAIRQVVREAREFLSEVDKPTPRKAAARPQRHEDDTPAEFTDQDELGW